MGAFIIVLTIVDILTAIGLVSLVLFQQGQSRGLGAIAGGAETFFGKTKGRSIDAMLKKLTTVIAILFIVLTITLYLMTGRGI
ncbi:MAG: preprotein translocase subunit SecG [Saccharofermentanales bacterium]